MNTIAVMPCMNTEIGQALKAYRLKRGLSYAKISEMTGITESTLRRIGSGQTEKPHEMTIYVLTQKLPGLRKSA